jgi:HEAT repeat protein
LVDGAGKHICGERTRKLRSPNKTERIGAIVALGKSGHEGALGPLVQVILEGKSYLEKDRECQTAAIRALGELGQPGAIPTLLSALADSDSNLKKEASSALLRLGPHSIGPLVSSLVDAKGRFGVKWRFASLLSELGWAPANDSEKASFYVAREDYVRAASAGPPAVEPLLVAAGSGVFIASRIREVLAALKRLKYPDVAQLYVKWGLYDAASKCGREAIEPLFEALLRDRTKDLRVREICEAILRIDRSESVKKKLVEIARDVVSKADVALRWEQWRGPQSEHEAEIDRALDSHGMAREQALEFLANETPEAVLGDLFARLTARGDVGWIYRYKGLSIERISAKICELVLKLWSDRPKLRPQITELAVRALPTLLKNEYRSMLFEEFEDHGEGTGRIYFRRFKPFAILPGTLLHLYQKIGAPAANLVEGLEAAFENAAGPHRFEREATLRQIAQSWPEVKTC